MGFDKAQMKQLLVDCGRRCCICGKLHRVQVHHIEPGNDDINNGIPLCPNCHDEAHIKYSPGRTTRSYSPEELRLHRKRTIDKVKRETKWEPGGVDYRRDKKLIEYFAQCLDRPAFRTYFHQELCFSAFDQAMEDTIIAFNTGYWKTRDNILIQRSKGKACVVNPEWRSKLEQITNLIEDIRRKFADLFGLNEMLVHFHGPRHLYYREFESFMDGFRGDHNLSNIMDEKRQEAINIMNSILEQVGMQPLKGLREHG